jgi:hypothetical protein
MPSKVIPLSGDASWYTKNGFTKRIIGLEIIAPAGSDELQISAIGSSGYLLMGSDWLTNKDALALAKALYELASGQDWPGVEEVPSITSGDSLSSGLNMT